MKAIIGWMQRLLGRQPWCVRWAVKVRNQAEVLIEIGLSPHLWASARNGEHLLLSRLAGSIRRFVDVGALATHCRERVKAFDLGATVYSVARVWNHG